MGVIMIYGAIEPATGVIAERRYCIGRTIHTSEVTSCIVVVCPVGTKLIGIHLSIFGTGDDDGNDAAPFREEEADRVGEILRQNDADISRANIFGVIDCWDSQIPGYDRLMAVLQNPPEHRKHWRSGTLTITAADLT
ncbi:uncharacterized protein CMC5_036920 [Chondromyces crocatus]|uniref:Uncharacterized protein n=2 Tax=Chondromyces crocatus TaxID=52 RepID=A0A0K1EF99_CHOCO|nr:uncharacterized protein CMC5_036920 [Chondromyces crocatus]